MTGLRLCALAVVCASIVAVSQTAEPVTASQSASAKSATGVSKSTAKKKTSPNLSPSEKQAFDLLESVHGQLGNFSAETQAYLLQEMAGAYASKNRPKQIALLKQALHAAGDIAETGSRYSEESQIITSLEEVDPKGLVSLENDASPRVRQQVREFLLSRISNKAVWTLPFNGFASGTPRSTIRTGRPLSRLRS